MQFRRRAGLLVAVLALGIGFGSSPAGATPIYFSSTATYGVDPMTPDAAAGFAQQVTASNGSLDGEFDMEFSQSIVQVINRPDGMPSSSDPYIVDMQFVIQNTSGDFMDDAVLAFTRVSPIWPTSSDPFPGDAFGFEAGDIEILLYSVGGSDLYLPALILGPLADGASLTRTVRLTIEAAMPLTQSGGFVLPEVGVAGFTTTVDEPAIFLLFAAVAAAVFTYRRGRFA